MSSYCELEIIVQEERVKITKLSLMSEHVSNVRTCTDQRMMDKLVFRDLILAYCVA